MEFLQASFWKHETHIFSKKVLFSTMNFLSLYANNFLANLYLFYLASSVLSLTWQSSGCDIQAQPYYALVHVPESHAELS